MSNTHAIMQKKIKCYKIYNQDFNNVSIKKYSKRCEAII